MDDDTNETDDHDPQRFPALANLAKLRGWPTDTTQPKTLTANLSPHVSITTEWCDGEEVKSDCVGLCIELSGAINPDLVQLSPEDFAGRLISDLMTTAWRIDEPGFLMRAKRHVVASEYEEMYGKRRDPFDEDDDR
jgi:hypothetical protein